jgi:outer membrane lipoprotein-sorting protein
MKSLEDIENRVAKFNVNPRSEMRSKVLDEALEIQRNQEPKSTSDSYTWRKIMKNPLVKVAAVTALIFACLVGVFMFNRTSGVAWAIEQSIEALSKYNAVLVEGSEQFLDEDGRLQTRKGKTWAVANEDQTKVEKIRIEFEGAPTLITNGRQTWRYDAETNTVTKNVSYGTAEIWCGSRLLEQLKAFRESGMITKWNVTEGKDSVTGKRRIFLACAWLDERYNGPRSLWLEIDAQSKLLVGLKQWENADWEGPARYVAEKFTHYEKLPDELFEFAIPDGATVIEH